jgi:type IV conjugative transfer system protein TraL
MELKEHLILHHLDDPLRILYWTVDEAAVLVSPMFGGLALERPFWGLLLGTLGFWGLRKAKRRWNLCTLRHAQYWFLPNHQKRHRHLPPSYIREYVS